MPSTLNSLLTGLTREQRDSLREYGVTDQLVTHWRKGRRLPTEVQVVALATVTGTDRHALQDEVALLRATPEQKKLLERVLGKLKGGAVAMLFCGLVVGAIGAGNSGAGGKRLFCKPS